MPALRPASLSSALLAGIALALPVVHAQTTLGDLKIADPTRTLNPATDTYTYGTWKPILGINDGYLYDPWDDAQTGIKQADFVSSAAAQNPGFFIQAGLIGGIEHLAFRIVLDQAPTNSNLYIRLGLDADRNGSVDLFLGPTYSGSTLNGISFVAPGTGLNISPNTSSVDSTALNVPAVPINASTYDLTTLSGVADAAYPGWVQQGANADTMISFAVPISTINAALADAKITARYGGGAISATSQLRWVAFTSNQQNTVNQDTYGLPKIGNNSAIGDTPYSSFVQIMNPQGNPIPEPATYGLFFGVGLGGFLVSRRRSRTRAA